MHRPAALLWILLGCRVLASPPEALAAALADARTLPPGKAKSTRYLDLTHLPPPERATAARVLSFHLNGLSRAAEIVVPRPVAGGAVLAIDLRDYEIDGGTYGRLGSVEAGEPYFHVVVDVDEGGKKVRQTAWAPWLPAEQVKELVELCQSRVAVVRGDWLLYQTAIQVGRQAGYYDLLGLGKNVKDFQKLVGLDVKEAQRLKLEMGAAVGTSGVALNNRGVLRFQSLTGGYWQTEDFKTSKDRQNAARLLDGDTHPPHGDAQEIYGVLPNGLFAYFLANDKGERQDSVPDFIAGDHKSTSNDRRIHPGLGCIRCHLPGLQPIDDFARRVFTRPLELRSPDYDTLRRKRQLYLSDLPRQLAEDNAKFARAVAACNGWTPEENARAYAALWEQYADRPVTPAVAAAELGCTEADLLAKVRDQVKREPFSDPVLASFAHDPPIPLRREYFEEIVPLLYKVLGVVP